MKFLVVGDIIGKPGRKALKYYAISHPGTFDVLVVNVENAAGGFGINKKVYEELKAIGVDVMTSGNHIWDKKEVLEFYKHAGPFETCKLPKGSTRKGLWHLRKERCKVCGDKPYGKGLYGPKLGKSLFNL